MSGIAGIFYLDGRPVEPERLRAMTTAMAYRGPQGVEHWLKGPVGLGHLQLATTPEALDERQPLAVDGQNYVITCDGRVDNREELIQALQGKTFVTSKTPDADLILHAYIAWGPECLNRIVGDFAFAIWDERKQELFCARDRMAMRPFNYFYDGRRFIFGSEIRSIFQHSEVPSELNEVMVGFYLTHGSGDGEQTFYEGIHQLRQGCFLRVSSAGIRKQVYWEIQPEQTIRLANDGEYVERFRNLFEEAVRCRLRSIDPVAVTLSGGLDSGSIISTAQTLINEDRAPSGQLQSFSSVFDNVGSADESTYIREITQRYQFQAHSVVSDDYWSFRPLEGNFPLPDHPFPIPHQARHEALLQQIQRAGINVVLNGEGGDEVLAVRPDTYFPHLIVNRQWGTLRRDLKRMTPQWRHGFYKRTLLAMAPTWLRNLYRKAKTPPNGPDAHNQESSLYSILADEFVRKTNLRERSKAMWALKRPLKSPYWRAQYAIAMGFGRTFYSSYYQQIASWHGIEVRVPFLDARLVNFMCRVPPEQKVPRDDRTKWLLRQAMIGILPESIRRRPDKGNFTPLFFRGMDELGASGFDNYVQNGYLTRLGIVDRKRLNGLFEAIENGGKYPIMRVICFLSLETWLQQFMEGSGNGVLMDPVLPEVRNRVQKGGANHA